MGFHWEKSDQIQQKQKLFLWEWCSTRVWSIYPVEFLASLFHSILVTAVHHEHQSSCISVVMLPVRPHLLLPPHVPHSQAGGAPVRLQCLHVEAYRWHRHHILVEHQFVQKGGFSSSVQTQHHYLPLFVVLGSIYPHIWIRLPPLLPACLPQCSWCLSVTAPVLSWTLLIISIALCTHTQPQWPLPPHCADDIPPVPCVAFSKTIYNQSDGAKPWADCSPVTTAPSVESHHTCPRSSHTPAYRKSMHRELWSFLVHGWSSDVTGSL